MTTFTESVVEDATLEWFAELGYTVAHGPDLAPGEAASERATYGDVVLVDRLRAALAHINPHVPADALDEALRRLLNLGHETPNLIENNRRWHQLLVDGLDVEFKRPDGSIAGDKVWPIDFDQIDRNDWLVVNQFTVIEDKRNRRPDVVIFVNGLPLGVIELKNAADENATLKGAFNQLQTYKREIPGLFPTNELLVISDGLEARAGTLTADWERFMPWRTIDGNAVLPHPRPRGGSVRGDADAEPKLELEVLIKGIFERTRFLDLIRYFTVFEVDGATIVKKLAGYHQYHAVNKAVARTVQAIGTRGDGRAGVIWHTQGSGKSLTMAFYAGKIIRHPALHNPTLVVLTDRNDLDDQLFGTFSHCQALLHQTPVQATDRENLRDLLRVASGGVVFTTIQKFMPAQGEAYPQLSERRNIIVIADEAHRSQYGFAARVVQKEDEAYLAYGFAKHLRDALPGAGFIGFTGTPIEASDRSTPAIFGDYIDIYDIQRAVEDGATVRIYYEGRLAKLALDEKEKPKLDPEFEEVTEGAEATVKAELKSKWARLEAMVGAEKRIDLIAQDVVEHFEQRYEALGGKVMFVCMSRRICVDLYNAIAQLRPEWIDPDDNAGSLKVVMTGSAADPIEWQPHIGNKARREALARRFKDPNDPFKFAIVRDMWLTGFDVPSLHTLYLDKPMRGHGLMQAIARVNRVFKDKPGGLVVDYLGLADELRKALAAYTEDDQRQTGIPQEEAVEVLLEKYEVVTAMFHGFDYSLFHTGTPAQRLGVLPATMDFLLQADPDQGKNRYLQAVGELSRAFALAVPHQSALDLREEVAFFQAVRAGFIKATPVEGKTTEEMDSAIRQLVSRAVASDKIVDIFAAVGLKTPNIGVLDEEFLVELRDLPQKNLALEMLRKLLNDEIKARGRHNVVQARSFAAMLEETIKRYQNRSLETAQVINELIELAKQLKAAHQRGEDLGLTEDELAFYDALEVNDSAVQVLGDETLRLIARELVETVRNNVTIDWTLRENVRANLRRMVRRVLRRHGYPPDKEEKATLTVLEQAEQIAKDWVG
jgi:type I restriction enzyme, R subunit